MELQKLTPSKRVSIKPVESEPDEESRLKIQKLVSIANPNSRYYEKLVDFREDLNDGKNFYNQIPIEIIQDMVTIDDQTYYRRIFVRRTNQQEDEILKKEVEEELQRRVKNQSNASTSRAPSQANEIKTEEPESSKQNKTNNLANNNPLFTLTSFEQFNMFRQFQTILIAQNLNKNLEQNIAIRIKTGLSGYTQWMNELQVYLLPNFMHENIMNFFGDDIDVRRRLPNLKLTSMDGEYQENRHPMRIQYWLLNNFYNHILLRDYLRFYIITWEQLLIIAKGITNGLHYLHEQSDYQSDINKSKVIDGFVRSTNGAIKKVAFKDNRTSVIYMKPNYNLSIIHRNLSTLSIAIRLSDYNPKIWDFTQSYIYHPFQPINLKQTIDLESRQLFSVSQYSPPEVLEEKVYFTLNSMKSVDMYAVGMIFWELMSRCTLPVLDEATVEEHDSRTKPGEYFEPFQSEFGPDPPKEMLRHAVCKMKARPLLKPFWLIGKKTNKFVQIIQDLWEQDYDARIHCATLLNRLEKLTITRDDYRFRYVSRISNFFIRSSMWPPVEGERVTQAPPNPGKCQPNLTFEESSIDQTKRTRETLLKISRHFSLNEQTNNPIPSTSTGRQAATTNQLNNSFPGDRIARDLFSISNARSDEAVHEQLVRSGKVETEISGPYHNF